MAPPTPGGILALDLSLSTGWAYGGMNDLEPISGTWLLRADGDTEREAGKWFAALDNEVADAIDIFQPSEVIMEAPLGSKRQTSARVLLGLACHAESCCYRKSVSISEQHVQTVRLDVLGCGRFPKGQAKAYVAAWVRLQGWEVETDDEADARVVWCFGQMIGRAKRRVPAIARPKLPRR